VCKFYISLGLYISEEGEGVFFDRLSFTVK
jgi:hypothetical protein